MYSVVVVVVVVLPRSSYLCSSSSSSSVIGNVWIGRFSFLIQKQNAITIQHSITNARQKKQIFFSSFEFFFNF